MPLLDRLFSYKRSKKSQSPFPSSQLSNLWNFYSQQMNMSHDRGAKLRDLREMGEFPDIAAFLDLVAEEATQDDRIQDAPIWLETKDEQINLEATRLFRDVELEEHVTAITRVLAHFGEAYFYNAVEKTEKLGEGGGIDYVMYDEPESVDRVVDERRKLVGYKSKTMQPTEQSAKGMFKPWEFNRFYLDSVNLITDDGESLIAPARRVWRMLKMMEDSMVIYRLVRAPDRNVFKIDVGRASPDEALRIVDKWKTQLRKQQFIDPNTGEFSNRWLPLEMLDDIYFPIKENSRSDITKLVGSVNYDVVDVEYFLDKLYNACRMPKAFFARSGSEWNRGKAVAFQDIRFARTIKRVQGATILGVRRWFDVHLAAQETNPYKIKYRVLMSPASNLDELQDLETISTKIDVGEKLFDFATKTIQPGEVQKVGELMRFIMKDILDMPPEIVRLFSDLTTGLPSDATKQISNMAAELATSNGDDVKVIQEKLGYLLDLAKFNLASNGLNANGTPANPHYQIDRDWRPTKWTKPTPTKSTDSN